MRPVCTSSSVRRGRSRLCSLRRAAAPGSKNAREDPQLVYGLTGHLLDQLVGESVVEVVAEPGAVCVLEEPRGAREQLIDVPCGGESCDMC